ncbi:FAD/NAD(P)-binding domain-containing protein [Cylindrobasidium torrendii FP15055 ss-10]|uniref:FAD/NAD(P)-binding domain-containing protein n=1 Tax=Cylindrobasidium torrendii FP15055 ss-10 TaxID=1314674 RepID=A0A0D7B7Y2_9AGAR|nr:FAD/NAD(P)-binding domain-containing protein [Cylindrobasidium torrendii FP15055 ss-10]
MSQASVQSVAIVYGFYIAQRGIAGLVLAVALGQRYNDLRIDVYEASKEFGELGLGLGMWPRPMSILARMGLGEQMKKIVSPLLDDKNGISMEFRKSDSKEGYSIHSFTRALSSMSSLSRQDLQRILLDAVSQNPNCNCYSNHRLDTYEETNAGVTMRFTSGGSAQADLLVGADGIRSAVRRQMFPGLAHPKYVGYGVYRGLIQLEDIQSEEHTIALDRCVVYAGKNKHVIMYPISRGKFLNVVAFVQEPYSNAAMSHSQLLATFDGWERDVQLLLQHIPQPIRMPLFVVEPYLSKWVSDGSRVVLLGDSAHAMRPHLGSGAGQAVEDAYVLASLLSKPLPEAVHAYDNTRREAAYRISGASRTAGEAYDLYAPELVDEADSMSDLGREKFRKIVDSGYVWSYAPFDFAE